MSQQPTCGLHNPHPLSTLRTELVWEGKYDEYGNRREYPTLGQYTACVKTACVKIVDTFGCDTSITVEVEA